MSGFVPAGVDMDRTNSSKNLVSLIKSLSGREVLNNNNILEGEDDVMKGEDDEKYHDDTGNKNNYKLIVKSPPQSSISPLEMRDSRVQANVFSWNFNIFAVKSPSPQSSLAWSLAEALGLVSSLKLSKSKLQNIFLFIEENYSMNDYKTRINYGVVEFHHNNQNNESSLEVAAGLSLKKENNLYHNNLHGADVGIHFFAQLFTQKLFLLIIIWLLLLILLLLSYLLFLLL